MVGFLDESSPQTTSNNVRVWSFGRPCIVKNTTRIRANTLGFYAVNGVSYMSIKENSKAASFCEFFQEIRSKNPARKILVVLDNFSSHKAKIVRETADLLGIRLVYLPPYSPRLNPIEFIWKPVKRAVSKTFIISRSMMNGLISSTFYRHANSTVTARYWIKKFLNNKFNMLCN